MNNSTQRSSTVIAKPDIITHRIELDKFFDMLMGQSTEFAKGFRTY